MLLQHEFSEVRVYDQLRLLLWIWGKAVCDCKAVVIRCVVEQPVHLMVTGT
jgi:hypothetical protein